MNSTCQKMSSENNPAIVERFRIALCCPIDCEKLTLGSACQQAIYELWYSFLQKYLPDPSYADLLLDFDEVLHSPSADSIADLQETDTQLDGVCYDIVRSRRDLNFQFLGVPAGAEDSHSGGEYYELPKPLCGVWIDEEFEKAAGWVREFSVVPRGIRPKHWASSTTLSADEFLKESRMKMDEGLLLPNITTDDLKTTCLDGIIRVLEDELDEQDAGWNANFRFNEYFDTWAKVFGRGAFRFTVWHEVPIGAYNGNWAAWMVCDVDPHNSTAHCYPALVPLDASVHCIRDESIGILLETSGYFFGTMPSATAAKS